MDFAKGLVLHKTLLDSKPGTYCMPHSPTQKHIFTLGCQFTAARGVSFYTYTSNPVQKMGYLQKALVKKTVEMNSFSRSNLNPQKNDGFFRPQLANLPPL